MDRPRAVLFDLDDTLVDRVASLRRFAAVLRGTYEARLAPCDADALYPLVCSADNGGYRAREDVAAELACTLPWRDAPPPAELAAYWTAEFPRCAAGTAALHERLAWLRAGGIRTGIVTNGAVERQSPKIELLGLGALVECVVVSEAVGVKKPDPRIFRLALDELGVAPEHAVFDSLEAFPRRRSIAAGEPEDQPARPAAALPAASTGGGPARPTTCPSPAEA